MKTVGRALCSEGSGERLCAALSLKKAVSAAAVPTRLLSLLLRSCRRQCCRVVRKTKRTHKKRRPPTP